MNWIELVSIDREVDLQEAIDRLSEEDVRQITGELLSMIGSGEDSARRFLLRLLLERARPMAIPLRVWKRRREETWSVQEEIQRYFDALGQNLAPEHLALLQQIYFRFLTVRQRVPVTEQLLRTNGFRCGLCGMRFYNEDLESLAIESPHGFRLNHVSDPYKPHYAVTLEKTEPTLDHIWPVSLYGDNSTYNQNVLCKGCNEGKAHYVTYAHSRPAIGHPRRRDVLEGGRVSYETFFARLSASPRCYLSGKDWRQVELTLRPIRVEAPLVFDNLTTVSYEALAER